MIKKAITPTLSIILLIIITVGLAAATYLFFSGNIQQFFTQIEEQTRNLNRPQFSLIYKTTKYPNLFSIILYVPFSEGNGTTTQDVIQNLSINLNGSWVSGINDYAYNFTGSGWIQTIFPYAIGKGTSYVFWYKIVGTDYIGTFFCTEDASNVANEDNVGQTSYGDRQCGYSWTVSSLNTLDNNWHFYAISKSINSTLCRDSLCVYGRDMTKYIPNIKRIVFNGGCGCGYANFANGIIIDEVMIFKKPLTKEEIDFLRTQKRFAISFDFIIYNSGSIPINLTKANFFLEYYDPISNQKTTICTVREYSINKEIIYPSKQEDVELVIYDKDCFKRLFKKDPKRIILVLCYLGTCSEV